MMGAFHVDALSQRIRGARVTVVNDFFADKAAEVAGRSGPGWWPTRSTAIADPEVDAVLIASPGAAHDEQVNACLDAGVPVLCEKPLTTDVASAYRIVQKEAALGRSLVQVGFMRRFDAEYVALKKLIDRRRAGQSADGALHAPQPGGAGDHFNSEFMIRDSVVHEVDAVRFLLDEEITAVQVITRRADQRRAGGHQRPDAGDLRDRVRPDRHRRDLRADPGGLRGAHRGGRRAGSVPSIGLDQNLQVKTTDGRWGGHDHAELRGAVRRGVRHRAAALGRCRPGRARSTGRAPGTATRPSRSARPASRPLRTGEKVAVEMGPAREARASTPQHVLCRPAPAARAARHRGAGWAIDWMELSPTERISSRSSSIPRVDDAGVRKLKKIASDAGVGIASVLPVQRWSGPDEDQRQAAVRSWKRLIQITVDLGRRGDQLRVQRPTGGAGDGGGASS